MPAQVVIGGMAAGAPHFGGIPVEQIIILAVDDSHKSSGLFMTPMTNGLPQSPGTVPVDNFNGVVPAFENRLADFSLEDGKGGIQAVVMVSDIEDFHHFLVKIEV